MSNWWTEIVGVTLLWFSAWWGVVAPASPTEPVTEPSISAERTTHQVQYVIDGDTIVLANGEHVRLLGIDTPERNECYYETASVFLRTWIEGQSVQIESDVRNRDQYGRLLRYIYSATLPDGTATTTLQLVNQTLLERGYATILPIGEDRRYQTEFYNSYDTARAAERGRWSACQK